MTRANAHPTKSLLLDTLTTDIELSDAILDLIDNSVDGIRRGGKTGDWSKYRIDVDFKRDRFEIADNCGGIPAATARDYAFRFGRSQNRKPESGLVGIYGVGMKRAIFKMGDHFEVNSRTVSSKFSISQDLASWRKNENVWEFEFDEFEETTATKQTNVGTEIVVTKIFPGIASELTNSEFALQLMKKVAKSHKDAINKGLRIYINKTPINATAFSILSSDSIHTYHEVYKEGSGSNEVRVLIYAGISSSSPKEAGWYIFCNGRMILEADQTSKTGWGQTGGDVSIPKIHNQFSQFRGYVFFDSDNQSLLPWTSTKSGINLSSPLYRKVLHKMINGARPIIDFLNEVDKEKELEVRPRHNVIKAAKAVALTQAAPTATQFKYTGPTRASGEDTTRIAFHRPKSKVERAKEALEVSSAREVGEQVFDYWFRYEIGR